MITLLYVFYVYVQRLIPISSNVLIKMSFCTPFQQFKRMSALNRAFCQNVGKNYVAVGRLWFLHKPLLEDFASPITIVKLHVVNLKLPQQPCMVSPSKTQVPSPQWRGSCWPWFARWRRQQTFASSGSRMVPPLMLRRQAAICLSPGYRALMGIRRSQYWLLNRHTTWMRVSFSLFWFDKTLFSTHYLPNRVIYILMK